MTNERRTDALTSGQPSQAPTPALPTGCLKEIGDVLALQRRPTEREKQTTRQSGIPFVAKETMLKITEILNRYGVSP